MLNGLIHTHEGLATLLLLSSTLSVFLALVCLATGTQAVVRPGTFLARKIEPSLTGIIGLLGIAAWFMAGFSIATPYLWGGVGFLFFQGMWMAKVTKPALLGLAEGESRAARWLLGSSVQLVLATLIFMWMKS